MENGVPDDHVDVDSLKCFGLFHNQGEEEDKAKALYNILQDGGIEAQPMITANDKDFKPNFIRLASLCTNEIFKLAHELGEEVPDYYEDNECDKMINSDNMDALIEDQFLETVFEANSRLNAEEWLEKVAQKEAKWIFTVDEFRSKVLEQSGVDKKH